MYAAFWSKFIPYFGDLQRILLSSDERAKYTALEHVNGFLGPLKSFVELELSYGEINRQPYDTHKNLICLYLSAKTLQVNVEHVNELYRTRPDLLNLLVIKYRAYHPLDEIPPALPINADQTLTIEDLAFHDSVSYDSAIDSKPTARLNLVIVIKQPKADLVLKKKTIRFRDTQEAKDTKERMVYLPANLVVDQFLLSIIGEYNLIHHIGYIEFLPSDDPLVSKSEFLPVDEIRDSLELIIKQKNYDRCNYCQMLSLQVHLETHGAECPIKHCSKECRDADTNHYKRCPVGCV